MEIPYSLLQGTLQYHPDFLVWISEHFGKIAVAIKEWIVEPNPKFEYEVVK